jgi:hypothetical protein
MKIINQLILSILVAMSCYSIYYTQTTNYVLIEKAYVGIFLVMINLLLFLFKYRFWGHFQGIILFLGSLDILAFTAIIIKQEVGFSISSFSVEVVFQPISLLLFFVWLVFFLNEVRNKLFMD